MNEVKNIVSDFKPEFLIFDCHGGYDENTLSTHLLIGEEKLTNEFIVENNISAPLIFISACHTAPLYSFVNTVGNGFFEVGALSVTTTYLPVEINSSSLLYIRILNNLAYASQEVIHKNWLEFICHTIRSSSINEAFLKAIRKPKNLSADKIMESNSQILNESLSFHERRELYNKLDNIVNQLEPSLTNSFSDQVPEYLFYSNLGRGDLINFEIYSKKHKSINLEI